LSNTRTGVCSENPACSSACFLILPITTETEDSHHSDHERRGHKTVKMSKSFQLTYNAYNSFENSEIEVIRRLEKNVVRKETEMFSQKCRSQLLASELFPSKNDIKKFTEQCKLNFFFPDDENRKTVGKNRIKKQNLQK